VPVKGVFIKELDNIVSNLKSKNNKQLTNIAECLEENLKKASNDLEKIAIVKIFFEEVEKFVKSVKKI